MTSTTKRLSKKEILMAQEIAISESLMYYWNRGSSQTDLERRNKQYHDFFKTLGNERQ